MQFKFEDLRVYQAAVDFSLSVFAITKDWPARYRYTLADQLHRAALSIVLNIAEGSGRTKKDFQHFLSIARGSCYECVAIITIAKKIGLMPINQYQKSYETLLILAKMLSSLKSRL